MPSPADVVAPLAFLIGTWQGTGVGAVPGGGGPDFPYAEELAFAREEGSPWLAYRTRITAPDDGRLLYAETGWWRPQPADGDDEIAIEAVIVRPSGVSEVLLGRLTTGPAGEQIELASDVVARTPTAPAVTADHRMYAERGGKLMYAVDLAADDLPLAPHLAAALDRVEA
ncbi:MAG TPA: FABP family protein [Mycobacteriales bacterium]|nr:FABP family protein [Mycobacteriales bacterium]